MFNGVVAIKSIKSPNDVWWPPNIVGDLQYSNSYGASGAFTSTDVSNRYDSGVGLAQITLNFSASKSDDLYAGNKLQVPALQALVCIKS